MRFAVPPSTMRVAMHTRESVNQQIMHQMNGRLAYYSEHPEEIDERLAQLDREWDIERVVETHASSLILAGVALSAFVSRKWLLLPAVVSGFFLQHAVQGWCPPIPVLRRMGFRTPTEIEEERRRLLMLQAQLTTSEHPELSF